MNAIQHCSMFAPSFAAGCASALLLLATGCASVAATTPTRALTPARLYPMPAGSAWSYDVDTGDGAPPVLAITRVSEVGAGRATVQGGEGATHYELRPDGIFGAERGGYLLKAPIRVAAQWPSGRGMQASVRSMGIAIETPAGRFAGCVEVIEQGSASGAVISTTYCPDVGPVQVISSMQLRLAQPSVQVVARLRGYRLGGQPPAPASDARPTPPASPP
jgi:hypothetical protein